MTRRTIQNLIITILLIFNASSQADESKTQQVQFQRLFPVLDWNAANVGLGAYIDKVDQTEINRTCEIMRPADPDAGEKDLNKIMTFPAVILPIFGKAIIEGIIGQIDKKLKKALDKYTIQSTATYQGHYTNQVCWRFVRGVATLKNNEYVSEKVLSDVLFTIRGSASTSADIIEPLRFFVLKELFPYPAEADKYGVSFALQMNSITTDEHSLIAKETVMTHGFGFKEDDYYLVQLTNQPKGCPTKSGATESAYCDQSHSAVHIPVISQSDSVKITANMALVATPPRALKKLATAFSDISDDVSDGLAGYAKAKIEEAYE